MSGLGGSSRDDARPFVYPNMIGIGERERAMRAASEQGKSAAAQNRANKLRKRGRAAFQQGKYSLGSVLAAKAEDTYLQSTMHSFRQSRYELRKLGK